MEGFQINRQLDKDYVLKDLQSKNCERGNF